MQTKNSDTTSSLGKRMESNRLYQQKLHIRGCVAALVVLASLLLLPISQGQPCSDLQLEVQTRTEQIVGRDVESFTISSSRVSVSNGYFSLDKVFKHAGEEVFIHFDRGHAFITVGNQRIEGNPFDQITIKPAKRDNRILARGVVLRLSNLTTETKQRLFDHSQHMKGVRSLSCAHAVCQVLRDAGGIQTSDSTLSTIFTASLFEQLISQKFIDSQGEPLQVEIYKLDQQPKLEEFMKQQLKWDREHFNSQLFKGYLITLLAAGASYPWIALFSGI